MDREHPVTAMGLADLVLIELWSDFQAMYCSLLEEWLGHDAASVIPGASSFQRPVLVKA